MKRWPLLLLLLVAVRPSSAGLLASATRVVYGEGARAKTLMIANTNPWPVIVQSWVDNGEGDPQHARAPFIALPVIFRLQPGASSGIRIIYNQSALAPDRESLFWLNLYEIPPVVAGESASSHLLMTMNTQMKLFFRPKNVTTGPEQAVTTLRLRVKNVPGGWQLVCDNPAPVYITFSDIRLTAGGDPLRIAPQTEMMVAPFGTLTFALQGRATPAQAGAATVSYLDDNGAVKSATLQLAE